MLRKKDKPKKLNIIKLFEPEEGNLNLPSLCKSIRQILGVTQEEMAQKLAVTKIAYAFWEQGRRVPKGWQALNLALIYLYCKDLVMQPNQQIEQKNLAAIKLFEPEKENLDFPSFCKFIRGTLGVTQEEMAQKLSVTPITYRFWEEARRIPKGWQALNLCLLYLHAKEEAKKQTFPENYPQESTTKSDSGNY